MDQTFVIIHPSATIRKIISLIALRAGWTCQNYPRIEDALDSFEAHTVSPAFLLLATSYSKVDYTDIIRRCKKLLPSMDVILCMTHDHLFDRVWSRISGARRVIVEPIHVEDVLPLLSQYSPAS